MARFGLQLLGNMIVPNEHGDFDVLKGGVTVSLVVTDSSPWQPTKPDDKQWNETRRGMTLVRFCCFFNFIFILCNYFGGHTCFFRTTDNPVLPFVFMRAINPSHSPLLRHLLASFWPALLQILFHMHACNHQALVGFKPMTERAPTMETLA